MKLVIINKIYMTILFGFPLPNAILFFIYLVKPFINWLGSTTVARVSKNLLITVS